MSIDDGIIKFDFSGHSQTNPLGNKEIYELEKFRHKCFNLRLIGEYEEFKVGYGNISIKKDYQKYLNTDNPQFLISGTQTGHLENLTGEHYTRVINYNLETNEIISCGPTLASSESLTHAAIYQANDNINAVIHIHSKEIWLGMLNNEEASTDKDIPYGTIEMANAVMELAKDKDNGVMAMGGHEDGVICYGQNLETAFDLCLNLHQRYNK